MSKILG